MKKIIYILVICWISFEMFRGCFTYTDMTHLSNDDLEWINNGKKYITGTFISDSGNMSFLALFGSYEANSSNPIAYTFETGSKYEAKAGYRYKIKDKKRILEGYFSVIRPIDKDSLYASGSLGTLYFGRVPLKSVGVSIGDNYCSNCFITDSLNCHIKYDEENELLHVESFIYSKQHGLVSYTLSTGEKFIRQFK